MAQLKSNSTVGGKIIESIEGSQAKINTHSGVINPHNTTLVSLNDTNIVSVANNQLLKYNSTNSKWENWTPNFMTTSHAANSITGFGGNGSATTISRSDHTHSYVASNGAITGATKCKITYDSKGLVTAGADLTASDIPNLTLTKITDAGTAASKNTGTAVNNVPIIEANGKLNPIIIPDLENYIVKEEEFLTTANQTVFNLTQGTYTTNSNMIDVYVFGQKQPKNLFTETNSTTITSKIGFDAGIRIIIKYVQKIDATPYLIHGDFHLTGGNDPIPLVTITTDGLMSAGDKVKLNGIEIGAQVNTVTSVASKTGAVTLTKSDVGLGNVTNESKATMFTSPTFTGTPISTTAAVDTNTTQIATTAFVIGQAANTNPTSLGTVAIGTSLRYARQDHVHPTTGLMTTTHPASSITGFSGTGSATTISRSDHTHSNYLNNSYLSGTIISDANNANGAGITVNYLNSGATNKPTGTDHSILTLSYSALWSTQLAGDWGTNDWYTRNQSNGAWGSWAKLYHSGNIGSWHLDNNPPSGNTRLNYDGDLYATRVFNAIYNDYAEYFERVKNDKNTLEPGDVIALDINGHGFTKSCKENKNCVVGVYSDTFGQCLGGKGDNSDDKNYIPIGLTGRVNVKVKGKIKPGDLLIPSNIPGVAMALKWYMPKKNIIGKALCGHNGNSIDRISMLIINS